MYIFNPTLDHKLPNSKLEMMIPVVCPRINSCYGERKQDVDDFLISSCCGAFRSARPKQLKNSSPGEFSRDTLLQACFAGLKISCEMM